MEDTMKTSKWIDFMTQPIVLIILIALIALLAYLPFYYLINAMNIVNEVMALSLIIIFIMFMGAVVWNIAEWKAKRDISRQQSSTKPEPKKE